MSTNQSAAYFQISEALRCRSYCLVQRKDKCGPVITRPAVLVRSLTPSPSQLHTEFHWTPGRRHPVTTLPHCTDLSFSIYSHTYTKSDWEIWAAAVVTDQDVRNALIEKVVAYASNGLNDVPLSDWYETLEGTVSGFRARPVVGGHLALLVVPDAL